MISAAERLERRERIMRTESRLQAVRAAAWRVGQNEHVQQFGVLAGFVGMFGAVGVVENL